MRLPVVRLSAGSAVPLTTCCGPIATVSPAAPRPLGSMFKLYVLGAVADAVAAGRLSWQQTVALSADLRSYLQTVIDRRPLSGITATTAALASPRDADAIEWSASPSDLCAQFARLYQDAGRASLGPVSAALSVNDAGIGLNRSTWPLVWFKGGSETGVLTLGYLARSATGRVDVVVLELSDPRHAIPSSAALSGLSLVHAAFGLAAGG